MGHEFDISTPPPPAKVMKKAPPEAEPGGPPRALEYEEDPSPDKPEQKRARGEPEKEGGVVAQVRANVDENPKEYWNEGDLYEGLAEDQADPATDKAAVEKHIENLIANHVVRDIPREKGAGMKKLTTRWVKAWRFRDGAWDFKARLVGREYRWQEFRDDLFAPGASHCVSRVIDFLALKMNLSPIHLGLCGCFPPGA